MPMTRKYLANDIADWFLCQIDREAGDSITHLKLQKLIYYAQAWALVLLKKELFEEEIEAWAHGPVVPSVYQRFKGSGWDALETPDECPEIKGDALKLLTEINRVYGNCGAKHLESLTHNEMPWIATRGDLPLEAACSRPIPKEVMADFYRKMYDEANKAS
jgi:uncharacterized phage-associated protein